MTKSATVTGHGDVFDKKRFRCLHGGQLFGKEGPLVDHGLGRMIPIAAPHSTLRPGLTAAVPGPRGRAGQP